MRIIKIKKLTLLFVMLALMFLISGCALFNIDIGIDSNNTAHLTYRLELDISQFNAHQQYNFKEALFQLATHYKTELGFIINLDTDSNPITLIATKTVPNDSFEGAFESLKSMLTDEDMTVFKQVDMGITSYPRQLGYVFSAIIDLQRIIKSNDYDDLPPSLIQSFEDAIAASVGTIEISLPGDEIRLAFPDAFITDGQIKMSVPLSYIGETAFNLTAIQNKQNIGFDNSAGAFINNQLRSLLSDSDESFLQEQNRFRSYAVMSAFIGIVLLVLTVVTVLIIVIVKKRHKY